MFGWPEGTHKNMWLEAELCSLCNRPFDASVFSLRKRTDHNYSTKEFRGIIHHKCNTIVGLLEDSKGYALLVAEYLGRGGHNGEV